MIDQNENRAEWLSNLKASDMVGAFTSNGGATVGIVESVQHDRITVAFGKSFSCFDLNGRSFWNTYGTSWLVPADAEFQERIETRERRYVAMETIRNTEWGRLRIEVIERIASIIQEEQAQ